MTNDVAPNAAQKPLTGQAKMEDLEAALNKVNADGLAKVDTRKAAVPAVGSNKSGAESLDVVWRAALKEVFHA